MKTITLPAVSFRHLETPSLSHKYRNYYSIVKTGDLPDLTDWRDINVRDPKSKGNVPNNIREGFSRSDLFCYLNRGLVISADKVTFDNKTNEIQITFKDSQLHGLLDGGHTYNAIYDAESGSETCVKVEFITGVNDRDTLVDLVDARNTSNQVRDESLMNLRGNFNSLEKALSGCHYQSKIAWSEYELDSSGKPKPIDVRELIAILMCFDRDGFNDNKHPINAYRSKVAALKHFKDYQDSFVKLYPLADNLLRLRDEIYYYLPDAYNRARGKTGDVGSGRFGNLTGVSKYKPESSQRAKLFFLGKESEYLVPSGFIYPILGAFRALLEEENGIYRWFQNTDPVSHLRNGLGLSLAQALGQNALEVQSPSKTGKSPNLWQQLYGIANTYKLGIELEALKRKYSQVE